MLSLLTFWWFNVMMAVTFSMAVILYRSLVVCSMVPCFVTKRNGVFQCRCRIEHCKGTGTFLGPLLCLVVTSVYPDGSIWRWCQYKWVTHFRMTHKLVHLYWHQLYLYTTVTALNTSSLIPRPSWAWEWGKYLSWLHCWSRWQCLEVVPVQVY